MKIVRVACILECQTLSQTLILVGSSVKHHVQNHQFKFFEQYYLVELHVA